MLQKVKTYLIIALVLFLVILAGMWSCQHNKYLAEKAEKDRLKANESQLLQAKQKQTLLILRQEEVIGDIKRSRDSLARALKVKPKQIEKIVTITNTVHDTIPKEVLVYITGPDHWKISDSGKCWLWTANAFKIGDSLKVVRTNYQDHNITTETFYRKRPHQIWFIHYGKWQFLQNVSSTCGSDTVRTIQFIK